MAEASVRLFIAIELPDEVRRAIGDAIAELKRGGVDEGLRWVRPEGIHVTLKFLGQTASAKVPAVIEGMRTAVAGVAPFELRPKGFGVFGNGANLRVLWIGIGGETDRLRQLVGRVEDAIEPLGFPREKRTFAAHLTLARVREDADRATRERLLAALKPHLSGAPVLPSLRAEHVSLMQSTLQRGGAVYNALETVALEYQHPRR